MFPRDKVNKKVWGLVELYSHAISRLSELSGRLEWVDGFCLAPFRELGEGDDADSLWIRLRALQVSGHVHLDLGRPEESVRLFRECMQIVGPDDEVYYLESLSLIRALMLCGREEDAVEWLAEVAEAGMVRQLDQEVICNQFYCLGDDCLRASLGCSALRRVIVKFMSHYHGYSEEEIIRLLDVDPEGVMKRLIGESEDCQ